MTTRRTLPASRLPLALSALKSRTVATLTHINGTPYFDPFSIKGVDEMGNSILLKREGIPLAVNGTDELTIRLDTVSAEGV